MKRRQTLKLAGLSAMPMFAVGAPKLPEGTIDASKAKTTKETFGEVTVYYEGPTDQLKSMTAGSLRLNPGMSPHPPHRHPEEEFMVIAEGTGDILVSGKATKVKPGTMMYVAGNTEHGINNTGKVPILFYYYKWTK